MPAYTCIATWLAVSGCGATPVPVDRRPGDLQHRRRPDRGGDRERTAAIVPVHLRGDRPTWTPIAELARVHGLAVIEDAAQAHGARHDGRRVGGLGDAGAFSFYPSKNLGRSATAAP